jgi:hypothetical protein
MVKKFRPENKSYNQNKPDLQGHVWEAERDSGLEETRDKEIPGPEDPDHDRFPLFKSSPLGRVFAGIGALRNLRPGY